MINQKDLAERLADILSKNRFYSDVDEIIEIANDRGVLELVKKAYGDSHERYLEEEFSKNDIKEIKDLTQQLKIRLPDIVWYD